MEGYVKGFVGASLVYFLAGAVLGLWSAIGDTGTGMIFAHVHLNLLGFMTMMIFGVGYFLNPRFNGTTLRWPGFLPYHFWLANAGLVLMVSTYSYSGSPGPAGFLFPIGAASQVLSVFLFCVHLLATIYGPATLEEELPGDSDSRQVSREIVEPAPRAVAIDPGMRVGEVLELWPDSIDILVEGGLTPLSDPEHVEHVKQMPVTLSMACARHGADLEGILERLGELVSGSSDEDAPGGESLVLPDKATVIKDVLKTYPETEAVFRNYYGDGCFSCPGQAFESISQSASMHNVDADKLLADIHRVIRAGNNSR